MTSGAVYDGATGLAGGPAFGAAVNALATERQLDAAALAAAAGFPPDVLGSILAGDLRVGVAALARLARALKLRAIEFLQQTELLSLATYAGGLDPLYFLPDGPVRHEARIYMREINPRHAVPETDMTKRNPTLVALRDDAVLDPLGRLELELAYLLRGAVQASGGRL